MCTAKSLGRSVLLGVVLGAFAFWGCDSEKSSPLSNQDAGADGKGGSDEAPVSCNAICTKADFCCTATMAVKDGGFTCELAHGCGTASSDEQLIAQCQTYLDLFPLNPACQ